MGKLFGTDGVRGIANRDLTCELAMNIGRAAAMVLVNNSIDKQPTVIIGKDTRLSSDMLENSLAAGLCSVGANVVLLGVVPTPAVAYLVRKYNADAGIMISASHNPYEFNGIKIFSSTGYKLPDSLEDEIENIILNEKLSYTIPQDNKLGTVSISKNGADDYIEYLKSTINGDLSGIKVAIDCSSGSASKTAEKLFKSLNADCHLINCNPNGININDKCGSTHIEALQRYVVENNMYCGLAFDGDADRCLAVDQDGNILDGDFIIAIFAKYMNEKNKLKKSTVVGTVMANMGFGIFCKENNICFESTKVGDRYVLENMLESGYCLGGEQSGHIIFLEHSTTGDGQLAGVQLLKIMKDKNKSLKELSSIITKYPQVLKNIKLTAEGKKLFDDDIVIKDYINKVSEDLGENGRILVRKSGTEPLIRVMLEGKSQDKINNLADKVIDLIKSRLGEEIV